MNAVFTPQRFLIDVDQFLRMDAAGIFPPEARIELIEGELLTMTPIGLAHGWAVDQLTRLLLQSEASRHFHLSVQSSIKLLPRSMPQPDLMMLRPPLHRYRSQHSVGEDVLVLIEVADSTLRYDRKVKMPLYARHGVAESWIVNVRDRRIECYTEPRDGAYQRTRVIPPDELATSPAIPALSLSWAEALPLDDL
jgi:Uma2 family endonuclease